MFKKSKSGAYLTVEKKRIRCVPLLVWKISSYDEQRLYRHEGCPTCFYKATMAVEVHSLLDDSVIGTVDGLIYILHEDRPLGVPTFRYFDLCMDSYDRFGFDTNLIDRAIEDSLGRRLAKQWFYAYENMPFIEVGRP